VKTALEQNREDQAMGAAWRRCEAAAGESPVTLRYWRLATDPTYTAETYRRTEAGATPTEALTALAEALEAR